jgi:hypothetical protein
MSQVSAHIGANRLPSLIAYDYLRSATMPDWAWECLRRNYDYQAGALLGHRRGVTRMRLTPGPVLTRLRARHARAETWGLACFR